MVKEDNLFNMEQEIWEAIRKDSVVATTSTRVPTPKRPPYQKESHHRCLERRSSTSPDPPSMSKSKGLAPPQDLALVPRRQPTSAPGFSPKNPYDLIMPPLEDAHMPGTMILFSLSTLESLEMTISHTLVTSEVHYPLKAQSFTRMSLANTSSWGQLGPSVKVKDPCTIITFCYIMEPPVPSIDLSKYPLSQRSEL